MKSIKTDGYQNTLNEIKQKVKSAQIKANLSVNEEMILLYWQIGNIIIERQIQYEWGNGIINNLAQDLKQSLGTLRSFSSRNLRDMKMFASQFQSS